MSFISNSNNFFCEKHFIFRENQILLESIQKKTEDRENSDIKIDENHILPSEAIIRRCMSMQAASDWFAEPEYNYSAMLLEDSSPTPAGCNFVPLRDFFTMCGETMIMLASRAKSILTWREKMRFCPQCATKLSDSKLFSAKFCSKCNKDIFPRLEPCIIVLVKDKNKYLLVRHAKRIQNLYACISGFIEAGET